MTAYILDPTFSSGSGFALSYYEETGWWPSFGVNVVTVRPDGRMLVGGCFDTYRGDTHNFLVQILPDGTPDPDFNTGTGFDYTIQPPPTAIPWTANVFEIALQPNGKAIVVGRFESYDGTPAVHIVRLNTDGSLDESFAPDFDLNAYYSGGPISVGQVFDVALQSDGKLVVAGGRSYGGDPINAFTRLNDDGSIDETFEDASGLPVDAGNTIAVQDDGKVICGITATEGSPVFRLNSDGSIDNTFEFGLTLTEDDWPGATYAIKVLDSGKILVGGEFYLPDAISSIPLIRLNSDGSVDESFTMTDDLPGFAAVYSISVTADGKIVAAGFDLSADGAKLVRFNADGTLDDTFETGTGFADGFYGLVNTAALSDTKIMVGGTFETFNGSPANRLARIMPTPPPAPSTTSVTFSGSDVTLYGDGDTAYTLVDEGLVMPGKVARIRYAADSDFTHGSVALASQWQQSFLTLRVRVEGVSETDLAAKLADLETAIGQFAYTVTVTRDSQVTVWQADQGSMQLERSRRFYADEFAETWAITIPVYPIYS